MMVGPSDGVIFIFMMMAAMAVLFSIFVAPIWVIAHYWTKARSNRGLTPDDERMLEDVWRAARRLESRVNSLEEILDAQDPNWRRENRAPRDDRKEGARRYDG